LQNERILKGHTYFMANCINTLHV